VLHTPRGPIPNVYLKELSITLSRSYGPGCYDVEYEEGGNDYPVGYVRWTEKRNMEAFVDFLANRKIDVAPLVEKRYPVEQADSAYAAIRGFGVLCSPDRLRDIGTDG